MDIPHILSLYDKEIRIAFTPPSVMKDVFPHVVRCTKPAPGMNSISYCNCSEEQVDAIIEEQADYLASLNQPFVWTVFDHDQPANLKDRLAAHGFELDECMDFMLLDLQNPPAHLLQPLQADVRLVKHRDQLSDIRAIMQTVWGGEFDWIEGQLGRDMEQPGYVSIYMAYVDDQPASAGWVYYLPKGHFAGLKGGSTLPQYRKHGLYTALLAARVQDAVRRGYHYLTLEAGPMSAPIAAKHGFRRLENMYDYKMEREHKK